MELVVKELESSYKRCVHTMTMHDYQAVSKAFQERTGRFHEVKQLQNRYSLLKKDWQSWAWLMDTRHCPTDISYNEETRLIQASDDWWAKYEKIDKNVVKFKKKLLEHVELMRRVYEGATATGNFAWTPRADFDPMAMDDVPSLMDAEDCEDSSGLPPFQLAAHSEHTADDCVVSVEQTPTAGSTKQKFGASSKGQQKKGQSEGASKLASSMENLASSVKSQQREVRVYLICRIRRRR